MLHRKSLSLAQWVKLGNFNELCFVGKDTVAIGCGCHILFYSLDGNVESIYVANNKERGDGVGCIAGHRTAPIFALAEKCLNPRILVFSYPAVEGALATLKGGTKGPYVSMAFSEMEYLVTLNGVPHFMIMVWCWRTGVQMACKETGIVNPSQRLGLSTPALVSQTAQGESRLLIWELNVCAKVCCMTCQEINLPAGSVPIDICFTNDGALLYVDSASDVFQVDTEGCIAVKKVARSTSQTDFSNAGEEVSLQSALMPCMTPCKGGVVIFEPPSLLKMHKRSGDWLLIWTMATDSPIRRLTYLIDVDVVIGWTHKGELITVDCGKSPKLSLLKYFGNHFIDMELVYPNGNTLVTVDDTENLQVWNKENGLLVGTFDIHSAAENSLRPSSKFKSLKANPCYPYVALAMTDGLLLLVNVVDPTTPVILTRMLLCNNEISMVSFAPTGDAFVAVCSRTGQIFLMQGLPGKEMQVVAYLQLDQSIVDCILVPDKKLVLALLLSSETKSRVGGRIALYILEEDGLQLDVVSNLEHSYSQLVNAKARSICFGALYCSRKIHTLELKPKVGVNLKTMEMTGHQLRYVRVSDRTEYGFLTYGMDGIVVVKPNGSKKGFYVVIAHHRADLGVKKAFQDPKGYYVITLGCDGSLICTKLKRSTKYVSESHEPSPDIIKLFSEPTVGFFLDGENTGITWLDYKEKLRIADEERIAASEKAEILTEFRRLQEQVVEMLDVNDNAPIEEQLPSSAFDLDKETRESAMEEGRLHRERLKAYTLAKITVMEEKSALIKQNCWDPMVVKPTSIESLVERYKVDNYALLPETEEEQQNYEMVVEGRKMEMKASALDSFQPWIFKTNSELEMQLLSAQGSIALIDETTRMKKALEEQGSSSQGDSETHDEGESPYVMSGSSVYHYIQPSPYHVSQFELNTYLQTAHSITLLKKDVKILQEWFNEQFQVMYQTKEKEMSGVKDLHQRLRHIFMELLLTCSVKHNDSDPIDPEWTQFEKPEMILTVEDKELSVEPYVSPSELAIRQQKAEEDERQRLLLLADNFRELALIKMMDGVLEIRWEDGLKKDIPKPKCMIEKDPEDYNEDDLRAVKEYEEKVAFLMNERQRYRKQLDSEYKRAKQSLKENINRFEQRLLELFELKLRVEAASTEHTLRILRSRLLNPNRMTLANKENAIRKMIIGNQKAMADEQALVTQLQESTAECRTAYEAQLIRDKSLDGKFKKEFPELSPMMLEVAFRLYRKRPKMQAKALVSATLMNELGRCAVAGKKPSYLPQECIEILKGVDALDNITNTPPNMNPESWANICRLRRQRIESEIKIKALALQIAEAETTVGIFQKNVRALKEKDKEYQAQLRAVHEEQLNFEHNIEIQIVMKQGLVEIPISGSISDFENAILINRKDVAFINEIIKEAGKKKLHAMRAACNFRRGIIFKEWEHRKIRMHIEDKEDELKTIESVKVIKELQEWLHLRQKGITHDRGILTLDKEMSRIRAGFERYIKMLGTVVKNYEQQIETRKRANRSVDQKITQINVEVNELQFEQDLAHENYLKVCQKKRMERVLLRAKLIRQVHDLHSEIIALENELDSLRLRTYPVLETVSQRRV